jgi:hypothetical protein
VALFSTTAVKELKKQAGAIGGMFGQVGLGQLSANDLTDLVNSAEARVSLRDAFAAASADVGETKATNIAVKAARVGAEAYVRLTQKNIRYVYDEAEKAIREMLGS